MSQDPQSGEREDGSINMFQNAGQLLKDVTIGLVKGSSLSLLSIIPLI
jgi:hypothetical protein